MSILRQLERRGADPTLPWGSSYIPTNGQIGIAAAGMPMNDHQALAVGTVFTCLAVLCDSIATLPLDTYRRRDAKYTKPVYPQPPLIENPWPDGQLGTMSTRQDFFTQCVMSLGLRGNFFGRGLAPDAKGYPTMIQPFHPDMVMAWRDRNYGQRQYRVAGKVVPLSEMVHIPAMLMPGSFVGLNPVEYMRQSWGLAAAAERYGGQFFANSANPSGVISTDEDLGEEETLELGRAWKMAHQGIGNAQYPAVLTGGARWTQIAINPDDAQFLQTRDFQRHEIASFFRIPEHMLGFQDRTSSWGCLPGDALVFTVAGPKPIAEITVGEEVWALGERGMELQKVVGWAATGHKPLLTFETTGRTVRATGNHHMLVRRYQSHGRGRRGEWLDLMVDGKDVKVGDYFMVPHGFSDGDRTVAPNGRHLTVGVMELLGLFAGDGNRDGNRIEIAHEARADHMAHYVRVARDEFAVGAYTDAARPTRTRFSSAAAAALVDAGFAGTALTKRVPAWVFRLTPELQLGFLRGYLDADGSVQRGRIVYSSANKALLEDVRHLCIGLGVPVGRVCFGRAAGPMSVNGGKTYQAQIKWQLSLSSVSFNSRIGSNSARKAARLTDVPTTRRLRYDKDWRPTTNHMVPVTDGWTGSGVVFQRVTSITSSALAEPVYDIEVAGNHTFCADGVVVANTGIEQMEIGFVINTLRPWLSRIESYFSNLLPPQYLCKFNLAGRLRGDTLQRYQGYTLARNGGWLNIDEIRFLEDLPPLPNGMGQDFWSPLNFAPIPQIQAQGVPAPSGGIGGGIDQSPDAPPSP